MSQRASRREFLKTTAVGGVGLWVVGSGGSVLGKAANEKVNVAIVGVGGRGKAHVSGIPKAGGNIVALCDVDDNNLGAASKEHPDAHTYNDFRKMLDERHKEIDAVVVATPDHTHAVAESRSAVCDGRDEFADRARVHPERHPRTIDESMGGHGRQEPGRQSNYLRHRAAGQAVA